MVRDTFATAVKFRAGSVSLRPSQPPGLHAAGYRVDTDVLPHAAGLSWWPLGVRRKMPAASGGNPLSVR